MKLNAISFRLCSPRIRFHTSINAQVYEILKRNVYGMLAIGTVLIEKKESMQTKIRKEQDERFDSKLYISV